MRVCYPKLGIPTAASGCSERGRSLTVAVLFVAGAYFSLIGGGCRSSGDAGTGSAVSLKDPERGRGYELYRPAAYDRTKAWPLVVVCAGDWFDSASGQIAAWKSLAESRGFLVVAPKLDGLPGGWKPDPAAWRRTLRQNEAQILGVVRHVRAGHHISDDRIFIHGWSDGAIDALCTGLRNPEIFRAISSAQPDYAEGMLDEVRGRVDSYQPVLLRYAVNDAITGKAGRICEMWLRSHGVDVRVDKEGSLTRQDVGPSVDFFERVIVGEPVVRIVASAEGGNPLARKFEIRSGCAVSRYLWEFGDGDTSPVVQPVHVYPAAGTYRVRVLLELPQQSRIERTLDVTVP